MLFFVLTETWLSDNFYSNDLGMFNYNVYRCDRSSLTSGHSRRGEVLIGVPKDIPSKLVPIVDKSIEHLYVSFALNKRKFLLSGVYFPPSSSIPLYETFTYTVKSLVNTLFDHLIVCCGDFNLPNITWSNDSFGLIYSSRSEPKVPCIPEFFAMLNFFQINNIVNSLDSILDLVFVSCPGLSVSLSLDSLVPADRFHPAFSILFPYVSKPPNYCPHATYFDFRRADFLRISEFMLSFNWLTTFADINANLAMNLLYDALY